MTDQILIIKSDINDAEAISNLENDLFSDPWSLSSIKSSYSSESVQIYKLQINNVIIGYMFIMAVEETAEVLNIAVSKNYQRMGFASRMLDYFENNLANTQIDTIFLEVRESNLPAQSLYKKHGFCEYGIRKDYYKNPKENAILMKKTIKD